MIANAPRPAPARSNRRLVSPVMHPSPFPHALQRGALPRRCGTRTSLPISVGLVPFLDPAVAQADVLLEVRRPGLDHLRVVARRIERRVLQRRQVAELLDLHRLPFKELGYLTALKNP